MKRSKWGSIGGKLSAAKRSKSERSASARKAVLARWNVGERFLVTAMIREAVKPVASA